MENIKGSEKLGFSDVTESTKLSCYTRKELKCNRGTSLVVQWLRLSASTTGGTCSNRGRELRSHMLHGVARKKKERKKKKTNIKMENKIQPYQ